MAWSIPLNAVLERELRARARRRSMPRLVTVFLLLAVGVVALVWSATRGDAGDGSIFAFANYARVGRQVFEWTTLALFVMVSFMVPGFTAASITGERDRQTLVPMQVTLLRPRDIVFGKMASSASLTLFLMAMTMPILAVGYAIGGVDLLEVVRTVAALVVIAGFWGAISIAASSLVRRTAPAMVLAYAFVGFAVAISAVIAGLARSKGLLALNPFVGFVDFVTPTSARQRFVFDFGPISGPASGVADEAFPYWLRTLLIYGVLSALSFWLAIVRLRTPARRER